MPPQKRKAFAFSLLLIIMVFAIMQMGCLGKAKPNPQIPAGDYAATIELADETIQQLMKRNHFPSFAITLIDDQDTIWQEAYGIANLEEDIPAETDTIYKVWSVAKAFTAVEVVRLVQEGLIDLDEPIQEYIPALTLQSRYDESEPITVRHILTHRAGIPRNECHEVEFDEDVFVEMIASMQNCHAIASAGERYHYSNLGPNILAHLIEEYREGLFPFLMQERLLVPAGMENSAFLSSELPYGSAITPGYEYYKRQQYPYDQGDIARLASGNLYTTIEDMGSFLKFVFREGETDGEQVIPAETFELMFTPQDSTPNDPQPMALGWKMATVLEDEKLIWHDGGPSDGTGAIVAFLPERQLGVVLISNSTAFESSISLPFAIELLESMLSAKYGITPPEKFDPAPIEIPPEELANYTGTYIAYGEPMEIYLRGKRLKAKVMGLPMNLVPISENQFQPQSWLAEIGLLALLNTPISLDQLTISFIEYNSEPVMIINAGDFNYEVCPQYQQNSAFRTQWDALVGEYGLHLRYPSGFVGTQSVSTTEIYVEDDMLKMAGSVGPMVLISETELIILSGPYAGETIEVDPATGTLIYQRVVYQKK